MAAPTWDTTTGIQSLSVVTGFSFLAGWGAASVSGTVSFNVYIREGSDPDAFGRSSAYFLFNTTKRSVRLFTLQDMLNPFLVGKTYHVIVKAINEASEEDANVVALTITLGTQQITWLDVSNTIRNRFKIQVKDQITGGLPTQQDNAPFKVPTSGIYCRLKLDYDDSSQEEFGNNKSFRKHGIVIAQIYGPLKKGDKDLLIVGDFIARRFRAVTDGAVTFNTSSLKPKGRKGKHWRVDVECPFFANNIVSS